MAQALTAAGQVKLGLGGEVWGVVMIAAAALIAALVTLRTRNAGYALAVIWALVAVYVARNAPPRLTESTVVAWTAVGAAAVVALALALVLTTRHRRTG